MAVIDRRIVERLWDADDRRYALMEPVDVPMVPEQPQGTRRVTVQILVRPVETSDFSVPGWYTAAVRATLRNKLASICLDEALVLVATEDPNPSHAMIGHAPGTIAYLQVGWAVPTQPEAD